MLYKVQIMLHNLVTYWVGQVVTQFDKGFFFLTFNFLSVLFLTPVFSHMKTTQILMLVPM